MGREAESPVQYFEQEIPVWHGVRSVVFEFRYKRVFVCACVCVCARARAR
jgi:hypothetical protein